MFVASNNKVIKNKVENNYKEGLGLIPRMRYTGALSLLVIFPFPDRNPSGCRLAILNYSWRNDSIV